MKVKIDAGMNVMDAALATAGSIEDYFAFAQLNNIGLTDDLQPGSTLSGTGLAYPASGGYALPIRDSRSKVTVMLGQTFFDLAMQESGSIEDFIKLAFLNGLSVTDQLPPGAVAITPIQPYDTGVYSQFQSNRWKPASGTYQPGQTEPTGPEGISYWAIEIDFKVS